MKKLFYSAFVALLGILMLTGCANDDVVGVEKYNNYNVNFEKLFGNIHPSQNFNTLKTVTIDASFQDAGGNYTLYVFDGMPKKKGTSMLGKFENMNNAATVKVDVSKSAKNIYCVASNDGKGKLVTVPLQAGNRVSAKFDYGSSIFIGPNDNYPAASVIIAFEDLGSTYDFDFNDVVIKVDYVAGQRTATVTLMAVGGVLPVYLECLPRGLNQPVPLFDGKELHEVMGYDVNTMINTGYQNGANNVPFVTCEIEMPYSFYIAEDGAPFLLTVNDKTEQRQITADTDAGAIPQALVIGKYLTEEGESFEWVWPKEQARIDQAYTKIGDWISDPTDFSFLEEGIEEDNLYDGYDPNQGGGEDDNAPEGVVAIDLGLPSGTLWANMNMGAESIEDYGDYYSWGDDVWDPESWSSHTYFYKDEDGGETYYSLWGDISGSYSDPAQSDWGGKWVMPSAAQFEELATYCTFEWTTVNGVDGGSFTGPNGKSVFFPAGGWLIDNYNNNPGKGSFARYWSGNGSVRTQAEAFNFDDSGCDDIVTISHFKEHGLPIRPVKSGSEYIPSSIRVFVDLGLPSNTMWCNMNEGANSTWEYGNLYAWFDNNYKWGDDVYDLFLTPDVDIVIPMEDQIRELIENCSFKWTTIKGVKGGLFTGPNGKSIFFPAAGWNSTWDSETYRGVQGHYWSSSYSNSTSTSEAYGLNFDNLSPIIIGDYDIAGDKLSIRTVILGD